MLRRLKGIGVPLFAAAAAFSLGGILILVLGANPITGLQAMANGAFGSGSRIAVTAIRAAPLLLVGAGICIAFRAKVMNIGGESQIIAGGILSTLVALGVPDLPPVVLILSVVLAGAVGGAILGAIPGALKAYAGVNELLTTIMLNLVMLYLMNYLLRGPLIDPFEVEAGTRIPQTQRLTDNAMLPTLIPGTRFNLGVVIAILAAIAAYIILWKTALGFRLRAVGHSADAARASGINVSRNITYALALSGLFCGIAGALLVFGSEGQRMVTDGSAAGFTSSAGYNGIVAALFGGLHPLWTIPSSMLFAALLTGATELQRVLQVPAALAGAINGLIVIFVVSSGRLRTYKASRSKKRSRLDDGEPELDADPVLAAGQSGATQ